jgi:hypothetical protein
VHSRASLTVIGTRADVMGGRLRGGTVLAMMLHGWNDLDLGDLGDLGELGDPGELGDLGDPGELGDLGDPDDPDDPPARSADRRYIQAMPPQAYALVTLFSLCSLVIGVVTVRLAARVGGPRGLAVHVLPVAAGFLAFYLIGHRLGISIGPEIPLFGFQVALPGDLAIGFAASIVVALVQAAVVRVRVSSRSANPA